MDILKINTHINGIPHIEMINKNTIVRINRFREDKKTLFLYMVDSTYIRLNFNKEHEADEAEKIIISYLNHPISCNDMFIGHEITNG